MDRRRSRAVLISTGLACCAVAAARALTVPAPADAPPLPESLRQEAFAFVAREEQAMRDKALQTFPGDAWSQDDDFHASVSARVKEYAAAHGVSRSDVWRAFDDGLRHRWPVPGGVTLRSTVAPCRPRPIH